MPSLSVLGRFIHLYWTFPEKKEEVGGYGISNIFEEIASEFSGELIKSNVEFPGG